MAPKITDETEVRFNTGSGEPLLVRELTPRIQSDFVVTTAGGSRQDQGALSRNSSAGIAEDEFYVGLSRVKGAAPGSNLYVRNSVGKAVVVVQLEDK